MIYQSDKIKTDLQGATVATAAGFSVGDWINHIFVRYGEEDMTGNTSIGRLPVITIRENTINYEFQAEPLHDGTRTAEFTIRIYVATMINRSEAQWKLLDRIKNASLSVLTQDLNLGVTDVQAQAPVVTQCSLYQDIILTTETSYHNTYSEGT